MILVNFFVRIIGFTYEVLLSKILGAESMGLFQIAMSTLMIFFIFTSSGVPTIITKLIAEHNSKKNMTNVESIYKSAFLLNLFVSIILSIIILYSAEFISIKIFKNEDMLFGVYLLCPAIIILSMSIVIKSYFYGMKNIIIPSIGEIIENVARFLIIISILYYLSPIEPVYGAMIAILGISIGEIFNLSWTLYSKNKMYKKIPSTPLNKVGSSNFLYKILLMSFPLTISGFLSVILRFSNTIIIPSKLIEAGYSNSESVATFGRIMGMTMPLINLPFIVTSALVINLIPSLTEQIVLKKYKDIRDDIQLSIKATLLVSIPLAVLYSILSKSFATFLYNDQIVSDYIKIMGCSTIFFALQHNLSGILYGLNKQIAANINRLIGMMVQVITLYILVGNSRFGVMGIFISFYSSLFIIMLLDIFTLRKTTKLNFNYLDILGKPLFASAFMIIVIYLTNYDINNLQNSNALVFASNLVVGAIAYILVLVLTNSIPNDLFKRMLKAR